MPLLPLLLTPPPPPPPPPPVQPYLFLDDFDGTGLEALDRGLWNVEVNCDGGGNDELQCYVDSAANIFLSDGMVLCATAACGREEGGPRRFVEGAQPA